MTYPILFSTESNISPELYETVEQQYGGGAVDYTNPNVNPEMSTVQPITKPQTEYYPPIGIKLVPGDNPQPVNPNLIPKKPVNTTTPNVPFTQLEYMAWKYLQDTYLNGVEADALSVLTYLDRNFPDLTEEVKQTVATGSDLVREAESFLSTTDYDERTVNRLSKAFPAIKEIVTLNLPIIPDIVRETIIGAMKGTIWTLVTGEEPPPYVINSATAMEAEFQHQLKGSKHPMYDVPPKEDRAAWYKTDTSGLRNRWSVSLKDAQLTALEMLALPALTPLGGAIIGKITEFLKFQNISGKIDRVVESIEDSQDKPSTNVYNTTTTNTTVYEDKENSTNEEDIMPTQASSTPPPYPLVVPLYNYLTQGPKYTGGGGSVHKKEKSVPSYCSAIVNEALKTGDYSIVPSECRVLLEGKVGTNGLQGGVGTYPILSTGRKPLNIPRRRGNR